MAIGLKMLRNNEAGGEMGKRRFNLGTCLQIGLAAILILGPFFRGLYFKEETLNFLCLIGIISGIIALQGRVKKDCPTCASFNLMDWGLGGLALWYLVCIPFAASKGDAVLGAIRVLGYLNLYYASYRLLTKRAVRLGAWLLAGTGALLTYVGIGSSIGIPYIAGGWGGAMSSALQYHNALGGYLLLVIPVSLLLCREAGSRRQRYLAAGLLYLNLLGFVGAQSRGAYVFFVPVVVLALLSLGRKGMGLAALLAVGLWGALDSWTQVAWAGNMKSPLVLIWPLAGIVGTAWTEWLGRGISEGAARKKIRLIGGLVLLGVLTAGTLPLLAPAWGEGKATKNVVSQIQSIDPQDHNLQERLTFYYDALKMGWDRPLFGFGGGGWEAAYEGYQSYMYHSKEPHSEAAKILVETGIPGVLFYALIWLGFFRCWLKTWKERDRNWNYLLGISVLGIFLHSLMDFDLSESALFFTVVILLGVLRQEGGSVPDEQDNQANLLSGSEAVKPAFFPGLKSSLSLVMLLSGIVLAGGSLTLKAGLQQAVWAADALSAGRYEDTLRASQTALKYFPYQAGVYANLAQAELVVGSKSRRQDLLQAAVRHAEQATALDAADPTLRSVAAGVYSAADRPDRAYQEAKKKIELASLYAQSYEDSAHYALNYAEQLLEAGKKEEAKEVLSEVLELPGQIRARLNALTVKDRKMWHAPRLTVTPRLELYYGEALAVLGQRTAALNELEKVKFDAGYGSAALLLEGLIEEREGKTAQSSQALQLALQVQPQLKGSVAKLRKLLATNF